MNSVEIVPLTYPTEAAIEIPGSKSYTNRALIMAALTEGAVVLENPLYCDDTEAMLSCLKALGLRIDTLPDKMVVHNDISAIEEGHYDLFAHDSGTTMRFLLALLCFAPGTKSLRGSKGLNERPIKDLVDALRSIGADIRYAEREGQAPLSISSPSPLWLQKITIDTSISSQYLSALLMISPLMNGFSIILKGTMVSKPYVDMTIETMKEWGVKALKKEGGILIPPMQRYRKERYAIEGDYSSASYFFAIAVLTQSTITLNNLNPKSSQPDRRFLDILKKMGNEVELGNQSITITGKRLVAQEVDMEECPDQVQTMAVLAAFAPGITKIKGVRSLRVKETERVKAVMQELAKMGIKSKDTHDSLTIYGGSPHAATIETYGDHRMAMAFAVAGTKIPGIKILHPEVVNKTFPSFWDKLRALHYGK